MRLLAILIGVLVTQTSAFSTGRQFSGGPKCLSAATLEPETAPAPKTTASAPAIEEPEKNWPVDIVKDSDRVQPGRYNDLEKSIALPFLPRPTALDGSHAGDYGFDPLGLSEKLDFYSMQESEIRHSRLAMLAVVGWPTSELLAPSWMLQNGCAPSVLNGFNPLSFLATAAFFGAAGFFEYKTSLRSHQDTAMGKTHENDMSAVWKYGVAGDYNFDPLNLYSSCGDDYKGRKGLRDVEVSHGRVAMLGISYFAFFEAITGHPIVENNMLFHPNALFPLLVASYVGWTQIYEVGSLSVYPIELKYASEGEMKLKSLQRGARNMLPSATTATESSAVGETQFDAKAQFDNVSKVVSGLDKQFGIVEKLSKVPEKVSKEVKKSLQSLAGDTKW